MINFKVLIKVKVNNLKTGKTILLNTEITTVYTCSSFSSIIEFR
jgi:hypothetical protein